MHDACADADVAADVGIAEIAVRAALSNVPNLSKRKSRQNENAKLKSSNDENNEFKSNSSNESKDKVKKRVANRQHGGRLSKSAPNNRNEPLATQKWLRLAQRIRSARYFRWFAAALAVCFLIGAIVISQRETDR